MDEKQKYNYQKISYSILLAGITGFAALHCLQPVIPVIGNDLSLLPATASTLIASGMLGMAGMLILLTFFAERLPRKRSIICGLISCSLLTIILGSLAQLPLMLLARFLEGISIAFIPTLIMAYIQEELPAEKTTYLAGLYVSGTTIGGLTGRLGLSFLTDALNWRLALGILGTLLLILALAVAWLLPKETRVINKTNSFSWNIFSWKNKHLFFICFIGFAIMGNYVAACNFIAYVLRTFPYNFSQSTIGLIFLAQIFGSFSSALSSKAVNRFGTVHVIAANLLIMLAGIIITGIPAAICKIAGLCAINFAIFGAHACLTSLCSQICPQQKAAATALYMFCYYCGASVIGSLGGVFFQDFGWDGIIAMIAVLCLLSLLALFIFWQSLNSYKVKSLQLHL